MKDVFEGYRQKIESIRKEHGSGSESSPEDAGVARVTLTLGLPPQLFFETQTNPPNLDVEEKKTLLELIDEVDKEIGSRF